MDGTTGCTGDGIRHIARSDSRGRIVLALLAGIFLAGCDCEEHRKRMMETADKGYEDAMKCCKEIEAISPPAAIACLNDVREWRQELTTLIIQWYQACIDGNGDLAEGLLQTMKALFVSKFDSGCSSVALGPDGQPRTLGLKVAWTDTLALRGAFVETSVAANSADLVSPGPLDARVTRFHLSNASYTISVNGVDFTGAVMGSLDLGVAGPDGMRLAEDLRLHFASPMGELALHLVDGVAPSGVRVDPDGLRLVAQVAVESAETLPLLLPPQAWIEVPLRSNGSGFVLVDLSHSLRLVLPPSLGFADWNADGTVGTADWTAYFASPPSTRDLDLDGDADADDDAMFIASFRLAVAGREREP